MIFGLGYVVLKEEDMIVLLEVSLGFIGVFIGLFAIIFLMRPLTMKRQQVSSID